MSTPCALPMGDALSAEARAAGVTGECGHGVMRSCPLCTPSLVTTRRAAHADVATLLPMLAHAADAYPSTRAPFPLDPNAAAATLHGMIDYGVVIVAETDDRARWMGEPVTVICMDRERATVKVDGYEGTNTAPVREITFGERKVVGVIGGAVSRHPFDVSLLVLAHHFVVVDPAHRRHGVGSFLLEAFDREADVQRVDWVTVSLAANTPAGVGAGLVALGFSVSDTTYLREVGR